MINIKLKGHEKFTLREGWLNKGIIGLKNDPKIFTGNESTDKLGVGSNMVKAIRYYMQAFELVEKNGNLSELGTLISTYDEYFEDDFTLWILHSQIAKNKEKATSWYIFFNKIFVNDFSKEQLFELMKKALIIHAETDNIKDRSLRDDIDVLLNMYSKVNENDDPEDKNRCPFASLRLIKKEGSIYTKQQPELRRFSDYIVLYEIYCAVGNESSISIEKIADIISNIYNLSVVNINSILDKLDNAGLIRVNRTAGLDMVYINEKRRAVEIVREYYCNK